MIRHVTTLHFNEVSKTFLEKYDFQGNIIKGRSLWRWPDRSQRTTSLHKLYFFHSDTAYICNCIRTTTFFGKETTPFLWEVL